MAPKGREKKSSSSPGGISEFGRAQEQEILLREINIYICSSSGASAQPSPVQREEPSRAGTYRQSKFRRNHIVRTKHGQVKIFAEKVFMEERLHDNYLWEDTIITLLIDRCWI